LSIKTVIGINIAGKYIICYFTGNIIDYIYENFIICRETIMRKKKYSSEIGINGLNSISNLEADVMKIVWEKQEVTVREVHESMLKKEIAVKDSGFTPYTTVMSTMTHLAERGVLSQKRVGKTFIYTAAMDKEELSGSLIKTVANTLLEGSSRQLIFKFLSGAQRLSNESVEKLIEKLDEKK
jgi:BlaI family transcriptional regulator, penicillinase repressor